VAGRAPQHHFGRDADCLDGLFRIGSGVLPNGNYRRLIENNAFATKINEGVCGAKVDGEVGREILREERKHVAFLNSLRSCSSAPRCAEITAATAKNWA